MSPANLTSDARDRGHAAESRLDPAGQGGIEAIRRSANGLSTPADDDVRAAVAFVEEFSDVDEVAPVESSRRIVTATKIVVRKSVFFAVHHLALQVSGLGSAVAAFGHAVTERLELLEGRLAASDDRLDAIEERLDALEDRGPGSGESPAR